MSKRTIGWLHPIIIYLILLLLTIMVSWIGSIMEMRSAQTNSELALRSVLGLSGIRWAVRSASHSLSQAPIGNALMLFIALGAGRGSGLFSAFSALKSLPPKERNALYISMAVLTVYLCVILIGLFYGSHLLLGITGRLYGSPLYEGVVFLFMLAVCMPSVVYGFATGRFRNMADCINAFTTVMPTIVQFLVTMLIASQLIQILDYSHIAILLGLTENGMEILSFLLYWLPLPIIVIWNQKTAKEI